MEYPGNPDRIWEVRVYDHKNCGIYYERSLLYEEAAKVAKRYADRPDVDRVMVVKEGYKHPEETKHETDG